MCEVLFCSVDGGEIDYFLNTYPPINDEAGLTPNFTYGCNNFYIGLINKKMQSVVCLDL